MGSLELRVLGGFELKLTSGPPVPIARRKAQALLAYLACHPGQSHPRDKLTTLFWPEIDDHLTSRCPRSSWIVRKSWAPSPTRVGSQRDGTLSRPRNGYNAHQALDQIPRKVTPDEIMSNDIPLVAKTPKL